MSARSRSRVLVLVVLVCSVFVSACSSSSPSRPDPFAPVNALPSGSEGCDVVRVAASSEKAALLGRLADEFNAASSGDACVRALVFSKASGAGLEALASGWDEAVHGPRPDVWSPASTSWLRLLSERSASSDAPSVAPLDAPSVASTPLVVGMPRPMAEALGWPAEPIGWADLAALATSEEGWGSVGHPEWGPFRLGKTNPNFSTSGLNATVGTFFAATGLASDLQAGDVADPETRAFVAGVESAVVHYGDTTLTFLSNLDRAAREGRALSYVSAVTLEEKSVLDYNLGNPTGDPALAGKQPPPEVPLVAVYPSEGTLVSDNPFALLTAPWVTPGAREAAEAFLDFLESPSSQAGFQEAGFRSRDGVPGPVLSEANGLLAAKPAMISPPAPAVLADVLASWRELRKGARVMLVVDVSGSMDEEVGGVSKLVLAKEAVLASLGEFAPQDEVGLAVFSDGFRVLVPVSPFGGSEAGIRSGVASLEAGGGTALYASSVEAVRLVEALPPADRIDAVVVLSDGEDTAEGSLEDVLALAAETPEVPPVRLFTVGYGAGADQGALREMSAASGARSYDASDAARIAEVMAAVLSNF